MKRSLAFAFLILIAGLLLGFQKHRENDALIAKGNILKMELLRLGLNPRLLEEIVLLSPDQDALILARIDAERERKVHEENVRSLARELATLVLDGRKMANAGKERKQEIKNKITATLARIAELSGTDFRILVEEFHHFSPENFRRLIDGPINVYAGVNPRVALSVLMEHRGKFDNHTHLMDLAGRCLEQFAQMAPKAALEWLDQNKDSGMVGWDVLRQTLSGVAAKEPELALRRLMETYPEINAEASSSVSEIASLLSAHADPAALLSAIRKVEGQEPERSQLIEKLRSLTLYEIGVKLAHRDNHEAVKSFMESGAINETEKEPFLIQSAGGWIFSANPAPWLELMRANLSEETMTEQLKQIIPSWTQRDYNAVGEWLNTQPPGTFKETAVLSFVETLSRHEPEAARRWLDTVPDSETKFEVLRRMDQTTSTMGSSNSR